MLSTANTDPTIERNDANAAKTANEEEISREFEVPRTAHGTPHLSVIIPVYASEAQSVILLRNALDHLRASSYQDFEILVADDASPRGEAVKAAAQEAGARLVRLDHRSGPATARNAAAKNAAGDILIFMDADTSAHSDTLGRFARVFSGTPKLDAAMGSYDRSPTAQGTISRFRNLLHSFVHHRARRDASTFWAGCGAVRKERFRALGGFNENFPRPSIEDVEFGLRLHDAGGLILLDAQIQVTHHKAWTLRSMVQTDFFARAIPWAGLLHKYPLPLDINFTALDRISGVLAVFTLLATIVALLHGGAWWISPILGFALIVALKWRLFRFLAQATGYRKAIICSPLLFTYFLTSVFGLIAGLVLAEHKRDRWLWPAAAAIGVILLVVQIFGGAFKAEFTGHPDEPSQFLSGLILYDYLADLPRENPITWAEQYYLHYPKVAIGHWPPGYFALEGVWFLFLGPSRITAILLQWFIGVVALTMLYRLSRSRCSLPITAAIVALVIAAPVFQQSLEQTMADLCCLLWSVLVIQATVRLVERPDQTRAFFVVLWLLAAAVTKGTAVCLMPVPLLALLASRRQLLLPPRTVIPLVACLLGVAAWYLSMGGVRGWGGISLDLPWPGGVIGQLVGWGFLALAVLGLRREPLALVAGSVIVSTLGVSFVVRAMQEERHWILVLPAISVLSGLAVQRFRTTWSVVAVTLALAFFPAVWYRQSRSAYGELAANLGHPSRTLVSAAGFGEGSWIAVSSLAEKRPSSFIMRASKVLAESGWNGEKYRLLTPTQDAVLRRLDELAVQTVVLDSTPNAGPPPPHHALLQSAISASPAWSLCVTMPKLLMYCRIKAPDVPRLPLRLAVNGWIFEERIHRQ